MQRPIDLADAVEQYLTSRRAHCATSTYKQDEFVTRRFVATIGKIQVRNLTAEHVERWFQGLLQTHVTRDGRTRPKVSATTYNFYRTRIKELAKYLQARGMTRADLMAHVRRLPEERKIRQQPTPDVMWRMLDSASDPRNRAILATAMNTGLRANEISDLRVGDANLHVMTLRVRVTKSRLEDDMPLTSDLALELRTWLDFYRDFQAKRLDRIIAPSDYLFPKRVGPLYRWRTLPDGSKERFHDPAGLDPLRPTLKLHRVAQDALRAVGLETRHQGIHTLRRSAARALFDQLVNDSGYDGALRVTSSFLHHSNGSTTETYLGLSSERRTRDQSLRGRSLLGPRPEERPSAEVIVLPSRGGGS